MIDFEAYKRIAKRVKTLYKQQEEYLETIPTDIRPLFYDNEATNCDGLIIDAIAKELFGEMYEEFCWYVYEWDGSPSKCGYNDVEYIIKNEEDYFKWIKDVWYGKAEDCAEEVRRRV